MEDRQTLRLRLPAGAKRELLVEAGSLILAIDGRITIAGQPRWLADQAVAVRQILEPEDSHRLADGGWYTLHAPDGAECVLIAPDSTRFWTRVGRCLERLSQRTG